MAYGVKETLSLCTIILYVLLLELKATKLIVKISSWMKA